MKNVLVSPFFICAYLASLQGQPVTYYNNIKDIFKQNCTACHRQDGTAPFALENFEQAINNKNSIRSVVEKGIMPPWRPDPSYTHFLYERILSISDKQKIIDWIRQGCQQGIQTTDKTTQKDEVKKNMSADLVLKLPFAIKIAASTTDTFVLVEMPYEIERDTFISSFQFLPAHNSGIHHIFISLLHLEDALSVPNPEEVGKGEFWDGRNFHERSFSSEQPSIRGGWVPGQKAITMPSHVGWQLPKKGMLQYQIHYGPSPISYISDFELILTYSKDKVDRIAVGQKYGSGTSRLLPYPPLVIPSDSVMKFTISGPMDVDSDHSIIAISPHMHLLGKSIKAWLLSANGDTTRLINIRDWDFNEQEFYYPASLIKARKGDMLQIEVIMDNTSGNINNPNKPPKFVSYGPATRNEMIQLSIYSVPYKKGDETFGEK